MSLTTEEQMLEMAERSRKAKAEALERTLTVTPVEAQIEERFKKLQTAIRDRAPEVTDSSDRKSELRRNAGIPARHAKLTEFRGTEWNATFGTLRSKLGTGFILALIGLRGSGKTQIGVCLIQEQIERLKSSQFTTAMDIFLAVKGSYRKDAETDERVIVENFCKPKLLVIDEIQERAETAWEDRILTHLINRRYNDEKDTLLIGNATPAAFQEAMGASIVTRLNETGGIISCDWQSFR